MKHRRLKITICLVLAAVTFVAYIQLQSHDFLNYDDNLYITDNPRVRSGLSQESIVWAFTATYAANWHPLTWLSHMLDCELYGLNPKGHHLTNLLLHVTNALLLFLVLFRMTGAPWRSIFVAALFAIHPLHVESVAWVAERKDVLSTLFWILTIWAYAHYADRPGLNRYLLVLLLFALGLMAKPMLVTLPFVLLLIDYWPLGRLRLAQLIPATSSENQGTPVFSLILEKVPLLALTAVSILVTVLAQQKGSGLAPVDLIPIKARFLNTPVSYVGYIAKMVWPRNLAVFYPHPGSDLETWQAAGAAILLVCITLAVIWTRRRHPYLIVGWLWYLGTLVPVIGLVQVGLQAMADRYTYVPLVGLFIMVAWGVPEILKGWRHGLTLLAVSTSIVFLAFTVCTWSQLRHWRNSITLFTQALNVTSNNYVAHLNLGLALRVKGNLDDAIYHYNEALRIKPNYALAHNNLGVALKNKGQIREAMYHYIEALQINPDYAQAHNNMGVVLGMQGKLVEAAEHFYQALRLNPDYAGAHYNLGKIKAEQGKFEEAYDHFSQAIKLRPDYTNARISLEKIKHTVGKSTK